MTNGKSYVHDGVEVVKTGRKGRRPLKSGRVDEMVEITPKDQSIGTWKKWVNETALYEVDSSNEPSGDVHK